MCEEGISRIKVAINYCTHFNTSSKGKKHTIYSDISKNELGYALMQENKW